MHKSSKISHIQGVYQLDFKIMIIFIKIMKNHDIFFKNHDKNQDNFFSTFILKNRLFSFKNDAIFSKILTKNTFFIHFFQYKAYF